MGQIQINNFNIADLEEAIKNVLHEAVTQAVLEQLNPTKKQTPKLFSRENTADILCVSLPTLHEWTKEGIISSYRIGGRVLYKEDDILNALTKTNFDLKRGGKSC
ncbi:DNA binding domain-containing protein, excisionase family [Flaviramulus basaltis]|uniref:DNA binding domain-containing protein, excisionase family n=1 Tax=Flaviramulus basaltis TaxID=369401 RepID=A0A1K2IEW8_9FLAO|nr:helix-turn-helix domain-containing protein [Flaviramulus basaltis]SFZ90259.1 DNA binding domain-containing protein, excisionase family [Flaviramulus basaltis]